MFSQLILAFFSSIKIIALTKNNKNSSKNKKMNRIAAKPNP